MEYTYSKTKLYQKRFNIIYNIEKKILLKKINF